MKNERFGVKQKSRHAARMKRKARADARMLAAEKTAVCRKILPIKPRNRDFGERFTNSTAGR